MKLRLLLIAVVLVACVQRAVFAKGILEERNAADNYDVLAEKANAYVEAGDYAAAIPVLKRMHEIKPGELAPVETLGIIYSTDIPEERPELTNAIIWLTEAEKRGSSNTTVYNNLSAVYSLKGDVEKSEAAMNKAFVLAYSNIELISTNDDFVNFRTGLLWKSIADNYAQIERQLSLLDEFDFYENDKSITDIITFFTDIVTTLKELVPNIPAMQYAPMVYLAFSYESIRDYAKAESCFLEANAVWEKTMGKNNPFYAAMLVKAGDLNKDMGDYAKAESYYLEAKTVWEQSKEKNNPFDAVSLVKSLDKMGDLYKDLGDYAKAQTYYLEAKIIREQTSGKNHPDYATSLNNLGLLYCDMGDYAKAEAYLLEAKTIREQALGKNHLDYATLLNNLGILYWNMGDYAKAESYYLESKNIREKVLGKNSSAYALSLNNLSVLYVDMGDYAKAEAYLLEAKAVREQIYGKNHINYALSLNNLGGLYWTIEDYAKAESYYLESKDVYEHIFGKNHISYARALHNLGALYRSMEDYAKAESCYLESTVIYEKLLGKEHPLYANSLDNLGGLYYNMGNNEKAEPYYLEAKSINEQALGKNNPSYAKSLNGLERLYQATGNYVKAEACNKELCELNINLINQNFSFMSEGQRSLYLKKILNDFDASYSLSLKYPVETVNGLNYTNTLFTKGLLLRTTNAVRDAIYSSGNAALIEQFEQLGNLRRQISQLQQKEDSDESNLQSLEEQADALDKELTRASSAFRDLKADLAMNWQSVQKSLLSGEAAVEFVSFRVYDKKWTNTVKYAALVLKPDGKAPVWVPLCNEDEIKEILGKAEGRSSSEQARILYNANGSALFEIVWKPLEQELKGVKTIYYSPSGLLHKVAFNALPIDDSFKRLTEKYNLNLVSSTREVAYLSRNKKETALITSAVLYGGLDYDANKEAMRIAAQSYKKDAAGLSASALPEGVTRGGVWVPLPATRKEVQDIQGYLKKKKIPNTLYQDSQGNEESFKQLSGKKTGLIHLATHGFFLSDAERKHDDGEQQRGGATRVAENPLLRSGLLLAGGNHAWTNDPVEGVDSGILTADKIAGMNLLGTKLVVMSACQTGLGDVNNSEGVFGLQRAFKLAGVETLIMSLWEVDDAATALLMSTFYNEWLISGKSRQEAFKEAQKKVRAKYSAPFYWAAFVMMD
jgi:CHAT domain-containing protein/Flp pilus assembly protein TadD